VVLSRAPMTSLVAKVAVMTLIVEVALVQTILIVILVDRVQSLGVEALTRILAPMTPAPMDPALPLSLNSSLTCSAVLLLLDGVPDDSA
jgi:hypothetical protein